MSVKFYFRWMLLVCLVSLQSSYLFSQITSDQFFLLDPVFPTALPFLYVGGNDNSISIREQSDLKISFNRNFNTVKRSDDIYYPYSSYYDPGWNGMVSNYTVGYSPLPHFYGMANLLHVKERENYGGYHSNFLMGDIGIGAYYLKKTKGISFLKKKFEKLSKYAMPNKGLLFNALIGYSRGNILHTPTYRFGEGKFVLNRFYGKIGLDYQVGFLGIASDMKFGMLNYRKTTLQGHAYEDLQSHGALLSNDNDYLFGEFSIRFYVGMKYGQIYINGVTTKVNDELGEFVLSDLWSVGVVLDIQDVFKKQKNEK